MECKDTGLREALLIKAAENTSASVADVLSLGDIVRHNAQMLVKLAERVEYLERQLEQYKHREYMHAGVTNTYKA
jgi:hypothetical protein